MIKVNRQHLVAFGLLGIMSLTSEVKALPLFATQTGMDCKACHIQQIERLNKFGRKFMASGMTISQKFADANSSGSDINAGVMYKSIVITSYSIHYTKLYEKVSDDIAYYRGVPAHKDLTSPNRFPYATDVETFYDFIERLQQLSDKPVGFKIVISSRENFEIYAT